MLRPDGGIVFAKKLEEVADEPSPLLVWVKFENDNGGRACKPDSVRPAKRDATIIPLGHGSHCDSSSLPEGSEAETAEAAFAAVPCPLTCDREADRNKRAGPALPSYLALHHAGFAVPPILLPERWALTPPFHPCQARSACGRRAAGFPAACHRSDCRTGGIFSVALSVSRSDGTGRSLCHPTRSPGVTRRVALFLFSRTVSGLSSRHFALRLSNQRSSGPPAKSIIRHWPRCADHMQEKQIMVRGAR